MCDKHKVFFKMKLQEWKKDSSFRDVVFNKGNVLKAVDEIGDFLKRQSTSIENKESKTLHVLSIFMEIEDTSRSKYNYTMSENDRAFALYLLQKVMDRLSSPTDDEPAPLSEELKHGQKLLDMLRGYTDEGNDSDQLRDQLALMGHLEAVALEATGRVRVVDDDEVKGIVDEYQALYESFISTRDVPKWFQERFEDSLAKLKRAASDRTE